MKSKANLMVLKAEGQQGASQLNWLKWSTVVIILLAGLVANHYYGQVAIPVRMLAWLVVLVIAAAVASTTSTGQWVVGFIKDSRAELRKVVWPTRQETMQTALVVVAMVIVLALILWCLDGVLVWLIGWLTGQRS